MIKQSLILIRRFKKGVNIRHIFTTMITLVNIENIQT